MHLGSDTPSVRENGRIRPWCDVRAGVPDPRKNPPWVGISCAESIDRIDNVRRPLGLVERNGSEEDNIVLPTG